jgi:hypothetical protein
MAAAVVLLAAGSATAQTKAPNNIGCGLGSMVWEGQSGVIPQVFGATTNGTLGTQTFGISSVTSGCAENGKVQLPDKMAMFIDPNRNRLAQDMSRGDGESLAALADLIGIEDQDRAAFYAATQRNFERIMRSETMTASEVIVSLNAVMAEDATLYRYTFL